jgi:hypothetical protein
MKQSCLKVEMIIRRAYIQSTITGANFYYQLKKYHARGQWDECVPMFDTFKSAMLLSTQQDKNVIWVSN